MKSAQEDSPTQQQPILSLISLIHSLKTPTNFQLRNNVHALYIRSLGDGPVYHSVARNGTARSNAH